MARIAVERERSIYYEQYEGRGLPVILIHGWGMSCRVWDTTLVSLREAGHAVLTFDQRDCGQSDKDFEENSIEVSAGDVVKLAKHLGLSRAGRWVARSRLLRPRGWAAPARASCSRPAPHRVTHTRPTSRTAARPAALHRPLPCCARIARTFSGI